MPAEYQVVSAQVKHGFQYIGSLQLVLKVQSNFGADLLSNPVAQPGSGAAITLSAKLDFDEIELFSGVIVSIQFKITEHGSRLTILAKNKAVALAVTRQPEIFEQLSDKELVENLCSQHGCLMEEVNTLGLFLQKNDQLIKAHYTDWDYANLRAEANGTFIHTQGDKLIVEKPMLGLDPTKTVQAQYGLNVLGLQQRQDDRQQQLYQSWHAFDQANQELHKVAQEPVPVISANQPIQGKNIETFHKILNEAELDQLNAANQQLKDLSVANGTVCMRPQLQVRPGYTLSLQGFNAATDGQRIVSSVMHEYGQGGFFTYIQYGFNYEDFAQRYELTQNRQAQMYIGIVVSMQSDPLHEGRVQVRLPQFHHATTLWARMVQPYASQGFGWYCLPEVGDEVLVSFVNGNMDYPIVMGSLYSSNKQPPLPPTDDNHEKIFQTRSGMKWYWNDEKKIHEISTPAGNKITLDEDSKAITVADQNQNKITMDSSGIQIESAKDIQLKAPSGNIVLEAAAVELNATGQAKIKGSMVMIN